jgi:mono/diheme cytochrome c family protein
MNARLAAVLALSLTLSALRLSPARAEEAPSNPLNPLAPPASAPQPSAASSAQNPLNPLAPPPAAAPSSSAAPSSQTAEKSNLDVEQLFATTCGWCHNDGGRKAGKGPQLMGTKRSDDFIRNRIKHGKEGAMPAFGETLSDADIDKIIAYIRNLKPDNQP